MLWNGFNEHCGDYSASFKKEISKQLSVKEEDRILAHCTAHVTVLRYLHVTTIIDFKERSFFILVFL